MAARMWWLWWMTSVVMWFAMCDGAETPLISPGVGLLQGDDPIPALPSIKDLMKNAEERPLNTVADLFSFTKDIRDAAQTVLAKAFAARLRRRRRDLNMVSVNVSEAEPYPLPFDTQGFHVTTFHTLTTQDRTYFILGTDENKMQRVVEVGGPVIRERNIALDSTSSLPVTKIAAVSHHGLLWIVFGSVHTNSVQVRCLSQESLEIGVPQSLTVHALGALHFFSAGGKLYLVVGERFQSSTIYRLEGKKYFDQIEDVHLRTKGVKAITGFYDDEDTYYIVFGMTFQEGTHKESHERLQVYQFHVRPETWGVTIRLVQEVRDLQVQGLLQFRDLSDNKLHLAVLNTTTSPRLYWWNWDQFQEWQTLESPSVGPSTSMAVVTHTNLENVLCLSHQDKLLFYTDDMTGHYVENFIVRTSCRSVSSLQGVRMGRDYLIFYLCLDAMTGFFTLQARRLILSERMLAKTVTRADELLTCLGDLSSALKARRDDISRLKNDLATSPIMTNKGSQVWQGPITFSQGLTVTGTTTFTEALVLQAHQLDDAALHSTPALKSRIDALMNSVKDVVERSNMVLYFSEDQSFPGPITATAIRVDTAQFGTLRIGKLNGLKVAELEREVLLMGVDQQINATFSLDVLTAHTVTIGPGATINGIRTSDFMRQSAEYQVVTGEHLYKSMSVGGSILPHPAAVHNFTINQIPISSIVTKGSPVTFLAPKMIKNLVVTGAVNTRLLNGKVLSALAERLVYTDIAEPQTISGDMTLTSVHVAGNVEVMSINGVDLKYLDANTVKTTGDFILQGPVTYMNSLRITRNLGVPVINGVEWRYLLDRHSPHQQVLSSFTFDSAFVSHFMVSDNINGLDLSKDAVLVDAVQTIDGRIHFKSSVTVTGPQGVLVDEGVTVNNVDISNLLDKVANVDVLVVPDPISFNQTLFCSGDITAESINDVSLFGIENRYWRKSVPQVIEVPVTLRRAQFLEAVTGSSLNGFQMTDFLTYNTNQQISGTYEFTGPVVVEGDLQLGIRSTINGVDVVTLNRTILSRYGDQTIEGQLVGGHVTVGYLDLSGTLNGLDPRTDYLRLDRTVQHTGELTFTGKTVVTQMTLAGDLSVDSLNGLQVEEAARDLVLRDQDATIRGPHTLHLAQDATVVHLNVSGFLDGVNLDNLFSRALLKTSPPETFQEVTGHLHISGAVHFAHSLTVHSVNGKHFSNHLKNVVPKDYTGVIRGTKTFLEPVTVIGNLDATSVNGYDLQEFASQVFTKTGDQIIHSHYTFASATFDHLITPTINNINMSEILLVDKPGYLSGTTTFLAPLTTKGHLTTGSTSLAGCDLSQLNDMRLERDSDGNLHIFGPLRIQHLYVKGSVYAPAGVWVKDQVNLDTFLGSLVLKSKPQTIYGAVEFLSHVTVSQMSVKTINDVAVTNMFSQSLQWNEEETIQCDLEFRQPIRVQHLVVRGSAADTTGTGLLVGGMNVSWVAAQAVKNDGRTVIITGEKIFANGFTSHNLIVNNSIDGVPVEDLVTLDGKSPMVQDVTFLEPITVKGNLKVDGLVDGVDLDHIFSSRINLLKPQEVFGRCSFHAIRVLGDIDVEVINDVVLSDLVVREGKAVQVLEGPKTLSGGLVVHGAINTSLINGVDILAMDRSLLRINQPAIITNSVRFTSIVVAENMVGTSVEGHNAESLSKQLDQIITSSNNQYQSLVQLHHSIDTRVEANLAAARNLFVMLHYLGWNASHALPAYSMPHSLSSYRSINGDNLLSVKECGHTCACPSQTSVYKVWKDARRTPTHYSSSSGSTFFLSAPSLYLTVILQVTCEGGGGGTLKLRREAGEQTFQVDKWSLGLVVDAGIFVDNSMAYIVTAGGLQEGSNETRAAVVVLRVSFDHQRVDRIWDHSSGRSASKLDLTQIGSKWYLVVANEMEIGKVNKHTTVSTLFTWSSLEERFEVQRNYVGHRVTSAMFLKVEEPAEEHFLVLTQLRGTSYHSDTRVLVYRHDVTTGTFEEFQGVPTSDVRCVVSFHVGHNLYLAPLSQEEERLDVYRYIPMEGFRLEQSVGVPGLVCVALIEFEDGSQQVWVVSKAPPRLEALKVWHKGVDPRKL